jgi:glutamate carboxypeptidase
VSTALLNYFRARQDKLLAGARALVEQESPTLDAQATSALTAELKGRLEALGAVARLHPTVTGAHLVARASYEYDEHVPPIMLLGHVDTVWPRGTLSRRPFRVEQGRAYGPGIFDMKSGVTVMLAALEGLRELGLQPRRPVIVLLTCDEESGSTHSRHLIEAEAAKCAAVLVLEPPLPGGAVKTERKGIATYELIARGVSAHAGLDPQKGVSAVTELAHQLLALNQLNDLPRGISINAGVIRGGTYPNVIPAEASAQVDVRFRTMSQSLQICHRIESLQPVLKGASLEIRGGVNRPPLECTSEVLSLFEMARQTAEELGCALRDGPSGGGSDGNFTAALGIPTLDGLGVEGDGAHAEHEYIEVANLPWRAALLASLLTRL